MRMWLLKRTPGPDGYGWDEYLGFVVAANTSDQAREMAHEKAREEWWLDQKQTSVEHVGEAAFPEERIILDSFNAG